MAVKIYIKDSVATITVDNPPVNVIGVNERKDFLNCLNIAQDADVDKIIFSGEGAVFVAGADAKEFGLPPQEPHLPDILNRIEALNIPTIAAIDGLAVGAGLELALACRYRISSPTAILGLPEVSLGVVPGAGGTQRLPRLIGVEQALDIIVFGKTISADKAKQLGLIDEIAEEPLAVAFNYPVSKLKNISAISDRSCMPVAEQEIERIYLLLKRKFHQQNAPLEAVKLVENAAKLDFEKGMKQERETFLGLRSSPQAKALRHIFFAERKVLSGTNKLKNKRQKIDKAVVVGGGNMGASIAYSMASVGIHVTIVEINQTMLLRAKENVEKLYNIAVKRRKMSQRLASESMIDNFSFQVGYESLPHAQIAIEAAFEDMQIKQEIFSKLDSALPNTCILASNTSYLDINLIAQNINHPERVIGLHFFSPAHIMKLLEVIGADKTSKTTISTCLQLAKRLSKIPIQAGVCDGFIGNRILTKYRQITDILMLEGALPWEIDENIREFGFAMGPYEVQDLSGLDIAYANRKRLDLKNKSGFRYVPIADEMVETLKRLGRKTHAGWYDYSIDNIPTPSPLVKQMIYEVSSQQAVSRIAFSTTDVQMKAVISMIVEACYILEEKIAKRPQDIDLVLIHGYGFPRWRGGLMHYADSLGLDKILCLIESYQADDKRSWSVPQLLIRLVKNNKNFNSLN